MIGSRMISSRRSLLFAAIFAAAIFTCFLLFPVHGAKANSVRASGHYGYTPEAPRSVQTATPAPLASVHPLQLTEQGCCANPSWSGDSDWILYLDAADEVQAGLYAVSSSGGDPLLVHSRIGTYSDDLAYIAYQEDGQTFVERWADGTRWLIDNQGREVFFSPDGRWISWSYISHGVTFPNLRQRAIWVARVDGSDARELVTVTGGEFLGWAEGAEAILVSGRLAPDMPAGVWRIQLDGGAGLLLHDIEVPLRPRVSPGGRRIAFIQAFEESGQNGLWVANSDGSGTMLLDVFGAYRWMGEDDLIVIPMDLSANGPSLWRADLDENRVEYLVDLSGTGHAIINNDWSISPDGTLMVFRSTRDQALWLVNLPELE